MPLTVSLLLCTIELEWHWRKDLRFVHRLCPAILHYYRSLRGSAVTFRGRWRGDAYIYGAQYLAKRGSGS